MAEEHKHTKITVSLFNDHFVFCPRYRRKLFLNEAVDVRFKELVQEIGEKYDFKIIAIETNKDHCHLFVNMLPTYSPRTL